MIRRILALLAPGRPKRFMGEDQHGNKYYEADKEDGRIRRFVECPNLKHEEYAQGMIPTQWEGWIRGSIKEPPTLKDLADQELMREIIIKKAAEIKRKDDEAQKKAYEEGLISKVSEAPQPRLQQFPVGHASAPVFGQTKQSSEPASVGGVFEPGAWKPKATDEQKMSADEDLSYEPESWTPKTKRDNEKR